MPYSALSIHGLLEGLYTVGQTSREVRQCCTACTGTTDDTGAQWCQLMALMPTLLLENELFRFQCGTHSKECNMLDATESQQY